MAFSHSRIPFTPIPPSGRHSHCLNIHFPKPAAWFQKNYHSIKVWFVFSLIFSGFLYFTSCSSDQPSGQQQERTIQAEGYRVEPQEYTVSIRSTGELLSLEQIQIKAPVSGNVFHIHFQEGQRVSEGTLLLEIDNRIWQAQKKGLQAQLETAKSEWVRRKRLLAIEGTSAESVDQAQANVTELEARIEELMVRIDLSRIRAPFSGRLGMRNISPGAFLSQGETITSLVQTDKLRVSFDIPSRYASLAKKGKHILVIPSAGTDTVSAVIYATDPYIRPDSRSLGVRAMLENPSQKHFAGDFVQILFETSHNEKALLVPADAIISELNAQVVFTVKNGTVQRQEITTGSRTASKVHVLNGLSPGDTLMVSGLMEVREGMPVKITRLTQEVNP